MAPETGTRLRSARGGDEAGGEDVRGRIQRAAEERFIRYGFTKTTMGEIAADCRMSAANIYRYFASKDEIAAASARQWLAGLHRGLREIAEESTLPAGERLRRFVRAKLEALRALIEAEPHLEELIAHVCREREDLVAEHRRAELALVVRVLADGQAAGAFDIEEVTTAAEAFQAATCSFFHHSIVQATPREKLEADADKVVALLVRGLARRED
jgi:AcrR family transcriptional regulator